MGLLPIGITADDLTGAADTAAAFAGPAEPVGVSLDERPRSHEGRRASAVTTESRSRPPGEAYELVAASLQELTAVGAELLFKKVDSNLRGNLGAELAAVQNTLDAPIVLAPAFPARKRATVGGVAFVDGTPVADTEMAADPEAPVHHSDIGKIIRAQRAELVPCHCPLATVRAGAHAIAAHIERRTVLVADAETDADLDAIAQAALSLIPPPVLAGSAGLAAAVARSLLPARPPSSWPDGRSGPALAVLASSSDTMERQVSVAASRGHIATVRLPCEKLTRRDEPVPELSLAIAEAGRELDAGRDTLVYAVGPLPNVEEPVALVVEHLAHLAFVLARRSRPRGLVVGGGSTAHAVLAALGTKAIDVDDEPLAGVAAGVALGGELDGCPVALKPGAAGDEEAVVCLLSYLARRAAALEATR